MNAFYKKYFTDWFKDSKNQLLIKKLERSKSRALIGLLKSELNGSIRFIKRIDHDPKIAAFDFDLNEIASALLNQVHTKGKDQFNSFSNLEAECQSIFGVDIALLNVKGQIPSLKENGYLIAPFKITQNQIAGILNASSSYIFKSRIASGQTFSGAELEALGKAGKMPNLGLGDTFWIEDQNNFVREPEIFSLATDPLIISCVKEYFGCMPILVQANTWYSFPSNIQQNNLSENAQYFHQDKDFIKFLKVFIYLNDVDEDNGPHCYIQGSHHDTLNSKGVPFSDRVMDAEIESYYPKSRSKRVLGSSGTIIFGDTSCAHKGAPVKSGVRKILQFEYATSLYLSGNRPFETLSNELKKGLPYQGWKLERLLQNFNSNLRLQFDNRKTQNFLTKFFN